MTKTVQSMSNTIKQRLDNLKLRYWAGDNIAPAIESEEEKQLLIDEVTEKFENVLSSLCIDIKNDPNSMDTGRRLAKMYVNEIMGGRYSPMPNCTAFPNNGKDKYDGMLVVRAEIKSMCSHHHQPVTGVAYIGVIPGEKVIGLSKYARIAQWCARRGTLQEELCNDVTREIMKATGSEDVAVYIQAKHGCMQNR